MLKRHATRLTNIGFATAILAAIALLAITVPAGSGIGTHMQIIPVPCFFRHVLHIPCPSCGLTTSFSHIVHGELGKAFSAHLLGPLFFALMICFLLFSIYGAIRDRAWWNISSSKRLQYCILICIIIYVAVWGIKVFECLSV